MTAIIDYGVGNLFSLQSSLTAIGAQSVITGDPAVLQQADRVILPGVGAFRDARAKLHEKGLDEVVCRLAKSGKPLMGICLGMQLLFEKSYEYGEYDGLGLMPGKVVSMAGVIPENLKIPHIGWNRLDLQRPDSPIFRYIRQGDFVYFVHSYYATDCPYVSAVTEYGAELTACVGHRNVFGCQFHPEKSGQVGLNILRAFCELTEGGALC